MKPQPPSRHDLSSAIVRLQGFIDIVESDAKTKLVDADAVLKSARTAVATLAEATDHLPTQATAGGGDRVKARVYIQYAMRLEAQPLIAELKAQPAEFDWTNGLAFQFYQAALDGLEIFIGIAGVDPVHEVDSIGSVPAAVLAYLALKHLCPALVLNAGTCGGFQKEGHRIAEVYVGSKYVAFHHRRSSIPKMREYGIGKYPVTDSSKLRSTLKLPEGIVSSGDALDYSKEDQEYMNAIGGTLKEMEAAAIGWVCSALKTPFLPIKTVTDWVDHPADTAQQFKANYGKAVEALTKTVVQILKYLWAHPEDGVWG